MLKKHFNLRLLGVLCGIFAAASAVPAPAQVTAPNSATDAPAKENFSPQLDALFQAFKTRKYDLMKPLLDPKVKIGSLPQGLNDQILPLILSQLPEPVSYAVTGIVKEGDATRVNMTYLYANGKSLAQSVVFDANRVITALDLPAELQPHAINTEGGTRVEPDEIDVPFELRNHLILVSAELNGKKGRFLLDSGAPTLVLNADQVAANRLQGSGAAVGVGGAVSARASHIESFNWNGLKISDFYAVALPLGRIGEDGHVTQNPDEKILGLIGYSVFKNYQVTFDYGRKIITLVRTDKLGEPVIATPPPRGEVAVVPFQMHRHIPVFAMKVGAHTYQMGLDSGAGGNLIYAKYWADVQPQISHVGSQTLAGIGKTHSAAKIAQLSAVSVGGARYKTMLFAFEDGNLDQLNNGYQLGVDGLLGYEFLRQHVTSINYQKGEMRIYGSGS